MDCKDFSLREPFDGATTKKHRKKANPSYRKKQKSLSGTIEEIVPQESAVNIVENVLKAFIPIYG